MKNRSLIGAAGVHYVCAELSMQGLIALPTVRNTKGMDVIVLKENGDFLANRQVKTSSNKVSFWPVGKDYKKWNSKQDYYVFVRYYDEHFEAFLAPAKQVIEEVDKCVKDSEKQGYKPWAPCWYLPKINGKINIEKIKWRMLSKFRGIGFHTQR